MNCRNAMRLIHLERDDRLRAGDRRDLDAHLKNCASCRAARAVLAEAAQVLKSTIDEVEPPQAEAEWSKIRQAIRRTETAGPEATAPRPWWQPATVLAGAAAALAVALFFWRQPEGGNVLANGSEKVHVEFVEFAEGSENPMVYVDEATGFVVVWADVDGALAGS